MPEDRVLCELIKAKENIKRKYLALKLGEADIQAKVIKTLKPVIDPLNKIQGQTEYKETLSEDYIEKQDEDLEKSLPDIWFTSPDLDKIYGPKKIGNKIYLGKKVVTLTEKTLTCKDTSYQLTEGLLQLLFLKSPSLYTSHDLETYKNISLQTELHLTSEGNIKKGGRKYVKIISKLFPSGSGIHMQLQKSNVIYWDDPNELVDRLRLLLASKAAGNTGVSNEIISIFEELLEEGLIKRIPNV